MSRTLWEPNDELLRKQVDINGIEKHCGNCRHGICSNPTYRELIGSLKGQIDSKTRNRFVRLGCKFEAEVTDLGNGMVKVKSTCSGQEHTYRKELVILKDETKQKDSKTDRKHAPSE